MQLLEIGGPADPDEGRRAARVQSELPQSYRREPRKRLRRGRRMEIGSLDARLDSAHDGALELPRSARVDQLSAECTQQRLRHCRHPQLPHPLELRSSLADERIACEATQKLGVVGINGQDEPQPLQTLFALRAQHQASIQGLPRRCDLHALADAQRGCQRPVTDPARRIARLLRAESERVRAGGANDPLEGQLLRVASSASTPRSYARRRIGSASSARPCSCRSEAQSREARPALCRRPCTVRRSTARRYVSFAASVSPWSASPRASAQQAAPISPPWKSPRIASASLAQSTARAPSPSSAAKRDWPMRSIPRSAR